MNSDEILALAAQNAQKEDFEQAIVHLKTLLNATPNHEIALGMLAGIYAQLNMHSRAIDLFHCILKFHPSNPLARFQLGLALLANKQPEEALKAWAPSLKQRDDFASHFYSGVALIELQKPKEAQAMFSQAAKHMDKSHPLFDQLQKFLALSTI